MGRRNLTTILVSSALVASLVQAYPQYGPGGGDDASAFVQQHHSQDAQQVQQGSQYWWQSEGVFENTGNHPATQHSAGGALFTPQQSQLCETGSDCVPWVTCINGYIDTTGVGGGFDLRQKVTKAPADLGYIDCGATGNVCCKLPIGHAGSGSSGHIGGHVGGINEPGRTDGGYDGVGGSSGHGSGIVSGGSGHGAGVVGIGSGHGGIAVGGGAGGYDGVGSGSAIGGGVGSGHAGGVVVGGGSGHGVGGVGSGHAGGIAVGGGAGGYDGVGDAGVGHGAGVGGVGVGHGAGVGGVGVGHGAGGVGVGHGSGVGGVGSGHAGGISVGGGAGGYDGVGDVGVGHGAGVGGVGVGHGAGGVGVGHGSGHAGGIAVGGGDGGYDGVGVGGAGVGHGAGIGGVGVGHGSGVGGVGSGHAGGIAVGGGDGGYDGVGVGGVGSGHGAGIGGVGVGHGSGIGGVGGVGHGAGGVASGHGSGVAVGGGAGGYGGSVGGSSGSASGVANLHDAGSAGGFCSPQEDCVLADTCQNGYVNTDGVGLIDLRIKPTGQTKGNYRTCILKDYGTPGVCCRLHESAPVVSVCPDYGICTDYSYCDANGFIVPDPYSQLTYSSGIDCYTNPGASLNVGVCCQPKPSPTTPAPPKYIDCPIESECIPEDFCFGEIYDNVQTFSSYDSPKSWSECLITKEAGLGVCCRNPKPVVPNTCGVSHYANYGDNLKTRFYPNKIEKLEADFGEMPWQAIVFFANYTFKCGASLISDRHLLTVAHCVKDLYPENIKIRLGEWQVNTFSEPLPYQDVDIASINIHPDYDGKRQWNNLAILEMREPVSLQYNINNICLPFGGTQKFAPGTKCWVSGWGKDSFVDGKYQHILKKIDVPLVDQYSCQESLRKTKLGAYFQLHESYLCAGGEKGKDACVGDGGGPLICYDELSQAYTQVGIVAWGIGCGEEYPAAYTDVSKFTPWISQVTGLGPVADVVGNYGK